MRRKAVSLLILLGMLTALTIGSIGKAGCGYWEELDDGSLIWIKTGCGN